MHSGSHCPLKRADHAILPSLTFGTASAGNHFSDKNPSYCFLSAFSAGTASAMLRVRSLGVRRCVVCLDVEELGGNTIGRD